MTNSVIDEKIIPVFYLVRSIERNLFYLYKLSMDSSADLENFRRRGLDGRGRGECKGGLRKRGLGPVDLRTICTVGEWALSLYIKALWTYYINYVRHMSDIPSHLGPAL